MSNATKKVLPRDVYDALELSALAFGGIGAGMVWEDNCEVPYCALGHLCFISPDTDEALTDSVRDAIGRSIIDANDTAVSRINDRLGRDPFSRVTFEQWCKELNLVRGSR